ncbi:MAG: hypothetical protein AAGA60_04130 [Cyanobacteria bacterium P01_E01_bin.42]
MLRQIATLTRLLLEILNCQVTTRSSKLQSYQTRGGATGDRATETAFAPSSNLTAEDFPTLVKLG